MIPRIAIDTTAALHQQAGIGRYVRELTAAIIAHQPAADYRLFAAGATRRDLPPPPGNARYRPSPLSERNHNRLWHRLRLPVPVELWTGRVDLFHAGDFALPPTLPGVKTLVTVFDLAFERHPADTMPGMLDYLRRVAPASARRADRVIAISEATKADLVELYDIDPDKIAIAYPGVGGEFTPQPIPDEAAQIRQRYHLPADLPLILTVGTLQPRKNHLRLVQAFAQVDSPAVLVIAGGQGWKYDRVQAEVKRLGIGERVVFTGFVADADLPALYRTATVFAYPSLYEGFGIPPLEALACGVPVLTSNVSSLPEVVGDAGLLVDPLSVESIAAGLSRLMADQTLRLTMSKQGLIHARRFTWAQAGAAVWEVYDRLLAG